MSATEDREASRAARLAKIQLALQDPPARNQRANTPPSSKAPPRPQGRPAAPPPKRFSPAPRGTGAPSPVARPAPSGSPSISQQVGQGGRHQSNAAPPRLRAATPPSVLPQLPPQQPQHHHAPPARQQTQQRPQAATQSDRALKLELETLKAQFEDVSTSSGPSDCALIFWMQLLRNQKETEKALEEAQNVRYAKEGEVSILRKSMEKVCVALFASWGLLLRCLDGERSRSGSRALQSGEGTSGSGPSSGQEGDGCGDRANEDAVLIQGKLFRAPPRRPGGV